MLKFKTVGALINRNSKLTFSYDRLHVRTFNACCKSLGARYPHTQERSHNFLSPDLNASSHTLVIKEKRLSER